MATQSRSPWLAADASDDDENSQDQEQGYDSEAAEARRPSHRATKRRRLSPTSDASRSDGDSVAFPDDDDDDDEEGNLRTRPRKERKLGKDPAAANGGSSTTTTTTTTTHDPRFNLSSLEQHTTNSPSPPIRSTNTPAHLPSSKTDSPSSSKTQKRPSKPGILYISRIPPYMRPSTLRTLLTPHAPKHGLHRLFLTPEPPASRTLRVRNHGNKKTLYTDGWIEFRSKREAKLACAQLNCQTIGGKKGGYYRDDVWNLRYLRGFGWERDLVGVGGGEARERGARVEEGARLQRREDRRFLESVEGRRGEVGMGKRRAEKERARVERSGGGGGGGGAAGGVSNDNGEAVDGGAAEQKKKIKAEKRRGFTTHFKQNEVIHRDADGQRKPAEDVQRVLSKIF